MIKICYISTLTVRGRSSKYPKRSDQILKRLELMGHNVYRFTIHPFKLPSLYLSYGFGIVYALIRFRRVKAELILADGLESGVLAVVAKYIYRLPFVFDFIDDYVSISRYDGWKLRSHLFLFLSKKIPKFADLVIIPCREIEEFCLEAGVSRDKLIMIPNGVNPEVFKPQDGSRELKRYFGIESERIVVFVGRVNRYYRLDPLLKAIPKIVEEIPNTKFILVGDGDDFERMKALCQQLRIEDRVVFAGFLSPGEIPKIINIADLCIFTLPYAMALINFEYLACARPVIIPTRENKQRELLDNYLFWIDWSPSGFSKGISNLLKDEKLRIKMGQRGREEIVKNYDWDILARKYEENLSKIA